MISDYHRFTCLILPSKTVAFHPLTAVSMRDHGVGSWGRVTANSSIRYPIGFPAISEQTVGERSSMWRLVILISSAAIAFGALYVIYPLVDPLPPRHLVIAASMAGSEYDNIAKRHALILARHGVELEIRHSAGAQRFAPLRNGRGILPLGPTLRTGRLPSFAARLRTPTAKRSASGRAHCGMLLVASAPRGVRHG